jgi:two-component system, cell cycle sensor histidine kinase and response regulator CckA
LTPGRFVHGGHGRVLSRIVTVAFSLATFLTIPTASVSAAVDRISLPELDFTTGWPAAGLMAVLLLLVALWSLFRGRARRRTALLRNLFGAIFDNDAEARLITTPNGKALAVSAAWRARADGSLKNPIAGLGDTLFAGDNVEAELTRLSKTAAGGEACEADLALNNTANLSQRITADPLSGHPGWVVWSLPVNPDQAALGNAVRSGQQRLADFLEADALGFYSLNQDGVFLSLDDNLAAWLGQSGDEIVQAGRGLGDFLADNEDGSRPDVASLCEEIFGELRLLGGDGAIFSARFAQELVPSEDGRQFVTRSMLRRVMERGPADAVPLLSLRKSSRNALMDGAVAGGDAGEDWEDRFRQLFIEAPVGIALIDHGGRISECNGALSKMLDLEAGMAAGKMLDELAAPVDGAVKLDDWLDLVRRGEDAGAPLAVSMGEGEGAKTLFANILLGEGAEPDLVLHVLEAGGVGQMDEQGQQSQKMELVGQLAGGIAHDFNNLLTAMIGFCDLLLLRHSPKDQSFADIMQIKQNANRAANLVRQLLAFSRQQTLQPKVLNLTDVLAELSHLLRRLIGARIELNMVHGRELGLVKADQGQLEQVVINLAVNARDAMTDEGTLTIETGVIPAGDTRLRGYADLPDGSYVSVKVIDTGSGIPADLLEKIYEPFFTTKGVGEGTGLGLATVYGIVKQTGGYIFVDSTQGEGTCFTILLPSHDPESVEQADDQPEEKAAAAPRLDLTGAGTVLLVEDEDAVRLFGARALRNKGYEVIEAKNGEGALEILETDADSIDLLITDVVMPGVDGPTLIRQVRSDHPNMKVIFISGYTEDTFRKNLDEGEVVHFLPKPFSLQQLAGKVKEVMQEDAA